MSPLKKILIFSILFLTIHFSLSVGFYHYVEKNSDLISDQIHYEKIEGEVKFLFMGDSHSARSINTDSIPSSANLAFFGENCIITYFRMKDLLENRPGKPEYIFLPGGFYRYSQLFTNTYKNNFFYKKYIDYFELYENDNYNGDHLSRYIKYTFFPYIEWAEIARKKANKEKKKNKKWIDKSESERKKEARNFIRNTLFQNDQDNLNSDLANIYLQKTIDLCKEHQVNLIFIQYPVSDWYQEEIKLFREEDKKLRVDSDSVLKRNNCELWNYRDLFGDRHDYFIDSHHMNESGKNAFTRVLRQRLDSLVKSH